MYSPTDYWAAKSGLDLAAGCFTRVRRYYERLQTTVMYRRWAKAYRTYYGLAGEDDPFDISRAGITGERGQLTSIKINHAGSITRRGVALVSQVVPEFECVPTNTDHESLEQASGGKKFLDYCMDTKGVGNKLFETALGASIFGLSKLLVAWDPMAGERLPQPDPSMPSRTKTGDLVFRVFSPLDLVVDRYRYDADHDWTITREFVSRWNLAARYPQLGDEIVNLKSQEQFPGVLTATNSLDTERNAAGGQNEDSDLIPLYTLYHRKTDALPEGKIAMFLSGDVLLYEGNLPYGDVPLVEIMPGKVLRTPYGESPMHQLLSMQDVYDNLASSVSTNNVAFATQIIMMPDDADYSYKELSEGLGVLRYSSGPEGKKPEAINLTAPNEQALKFMALLKEEMETIGGINSTLRGTPQPNIQSGAFAALVAQQALEYAGAFQYSFQQAVAKTGQIIIDILKQYADQPIVAEILGDDRSYMVDSFTKDDFSAIRRVTVKSGNPAARTPAFALQTADALLQRGALGDAQSAAKNYLTLARTGDLDTIVDDAESAQMTMRQENELLAKGQACPVVATDAHREHITHHVAVIGSPAARTNPAIVQATLEHINEHIQALRTVDPALLQLLGQTPLPPAPPDIAPSEAPSPPPPMPQQAQPPQTQGHQAGPAPVPPTVGGPGRLPSQPNMPHNPLTGARATPLDGALKQ